MKKQNAFCDWLDRFVEEKGIDLEREFTVEGQWGTNFIPVGVIVEHMKIANATEQAQIKDIILKIDFYAGDVYHFLAQLAKAIAI
jgi:hypothetical protein